MCYKNTVLDSKVHFLVKLAIHLSLRAEQKKSNRFLHPHYTAGMDVTFFLDIVF